MAAKKCMKCGKVNPHFFTHCVDCGAKLDPELRELSKYSRYLKPALIIVVVAILVLVVVLPAARYSHLFVQDVSEKVSSPSGTDAPAPEYPVGHAIGNNDFQITIESARDGQNTYNSNKFFLVSVNLKNTRTSGNLKGSGSDFELIDSEGSRYMPYSIGSKIMYDLSPSQGSSGELTFVIPQKATAQKIQFTFPAPGAVGEKRSIVVFTI